MPTRTHAISTPATALIFLLAALGVFAGTSVDQKQSRPEFAGRHYRGRGDIEHLRLLETARRMFEPDPELQNLSMLYEPSWNGLVEGPTWDAWWIQNSYGTTYSILPFLREPFTTFLQNSHDLWFSQMGDGKRVGAKAPFDWVAPDGALCDAARPGWIVYKQGDGRVGIHDWGMEFTAAGILMQAELLLISRDAAAMGHYLPMLERSANFIETRRDPTNNLFLAGPAGNLLAPSYAGWRRPDGSYGQAYLAGLSVTYIAALDRLIELEKLAKRADKVSLYSERRDLARRGLPLLTTPEGYFIRSLDPDGVKHGVFGSEKHGYFEASPNHDAIAFRVVDDAQSARIYAKIAAIPELRPHHFILPNYPSYDDMYEAPQGLWGYGTWVNGGHWSTCEARMLLAYARLSRHEDARKSMRHLLTFAERFRMDNPLTKCGSDVYQPNQPINLCYDTLGPSAAFMRGLFEYLYSAENLVLMPHVPETISELHQLDPVRFGKKLVYLSTYGKGPVTKVLINGRNWKQFDGESITLPYDKLPNTVRIQIALGNTDLPRGRERVARGEPRSKTGKSVSADPRAARMDRFCRLLHAAGLADTYEFAHAELVLETLETAELRSKLMQEGRLKPLAEPAQTAAAKCYSDTASRLYKGLEDHLATRTEPGDRQPAKVHQLWHRSNSERN